VTKIVSWNVNSIRVRLDHLNALIKDSNPDIIMLQETKSTNDDFPYDIIKEQGYDINNVGQKSYNGVAILSKIPVEIKNTALPKNDKDAQARFLEVKVLDKNPFDIASIYLPNGNPIDTEKFSYKLDWMKKLKSYIEKKNGKL
jgi:exodeoxyribonuclease-3